jgi:hypothetical protein
MVFQEGPKNQILIYIHTLCDPVFIERTHTEFATPEFISVSYKSQMGGGRGVVKPGIPPMGLGRKSKFEQEVLGRTNCLLSLIRRVKQFYCCVWIRCLATIGDTHIDTDRLEGFMKYAVEMGSDTAIYQFPCGSAIQKLIWRGKGDTQT